MNCSLARRNGCRTEQVARAMKVRLNVIALGADNGLDALILCSAACRPRLGAGVLGTPQLVRRRGQRTRKPH